MQNQQITKTMEKTRFAKYCNVQEKSEIQADVSKMSSEVKYSIVNKINALWQKSFEPEGRCRQLETPVCFYEFEVSKQIA